MRAASINTRPLFFRAGPWLELVITTGFHSGQEQVSVFDFEVSHSSAVSHDLIVKRSGATLRTGFGPRSKFQLTRCAHSPGTASTVAIDLRYYSAATAKRDRVLRFVVGRVDSLVRSLKLDQLPGRA